MFHKKKDKSEMKKACQTLKDSTNVLWSLEGQVI